MSFESIRPSKTGYQFFRLLLQPAAGVCFYLVSQAGDSFSPVVRSAHNTTISLERVRQDSLWQVHVPQRAIEGSNMLLPANPEYLAHAKFVRPSKIELMFADSCKMLCQFSELGIDPRELELSETHASESGNALVVKTRQGEMVSIDSASIRILVDADYAQKLEEASQKLGLSNAQLEEIADKGRPPQEWYRMQDEKPW